MNGQKVSFQIHQQDKENYSFKGIDRLDDFFILLNLET